MTAAKCSWIERTIVDTVHTSTMLMFNINVPLKKCGPPWTECCYNS